MKSKKYLVAGLLLVSGIATSFVYANMDNPSAAVEFFTGHSHDEHGTHGAPSHSGGTDRYGCHNRSVPYHCH